MSELYFNLLIAMIAGMLAMIAWRPSRVFEFPYFMAGVFAVFIVPQAVSLLRFPGQVLGEDIANVFLMSSLCLGMCILGYQLPPSRFVVRNMLRPVDHDRLFHVGIGFILISIAASLVGSRATAEFAAEGGLTGGLTIVFFFVNLGYPGFAICLYLLREKITPSRLFITMLGFANPLLAIYHGRREPAVMFVLIIVMSRFFATKKAPNPLLVYAGMAFMMLAIPATGQYRALVYEGRTSEIRQIDLIGNFQEFLNQESILELRNAAAIIRSFRLRTELEYGAGYWDYIIFRFVPAQIVGRDVKNALMISGESQNIYKRQLATSYEIPAGSTITGMGCSFEQFGWLGCLFFAFLALLFRSIWVAANQQNSIFAQLLYIMICTSAMRTVTHQTVDFLPGMIYQLVFLGIGVWYAGLARDPRQQVQMPQRRMKAPQRVYGRRPGHGMPLNAPRPHNPRYRS
jgi:hypothetical protein